MVPGHLEPAQVADRASRILAGDGEEGVLRGSRLSIDEIHDRAGVRTDDRGVRIGDEVADSGRVPVIAARRAGRLVHALLDDRPLAV